MSAPLELIRRLLLGRLDAGQQLLPACRTHAYGAEAFGGVMAGQLFAQQPAPLSPEPHLILTELGLAIFDADDQGREQAIFADLYAGNIGRLWRLGPGEVAPEAEPGLMTPADAMLSQLRDPIALTASDHPALDPAALPALRELAREAAQMGRDGHPAADGRALVLRAFTQDDIGAALVAITTPGAPGKRLAAGRFRWNGPRLVHSHLIFDGVMPPPMRLSLAPTSVDTTCEMAP